jgi:hypothetical protein
MPAFYDSISTGSGEKNNRFNRKCLTRDGDGRGENTFNLKAASSKKCCHEIKWFRHAENPAPSKHMVPLGESIIRLFP